MTPRPRGYCSVTTIGTPSALAPSTSVATLAVTLSNSFTAGRKASCTSTTISAVRCRVEEAAGARHGYTAPIANERSR